jgi:hypothetical protein
MSLPKQAKPVKRQATVASKNVKGIAPSSSCGCSNTCIGFCIQGHCQGVCA